MTSLMTCFTTPLRTLVQHFHHEQSHTVLFIYKNVTNTEHRIRWIWLWIVEPPNRQTAEPCTVLYWHATFFNIWNNASFCQKQLSGKACNSSLRHSVLIVLHGNKHVQRNKTLNINRATKVWPQFLDFGIWATPTLRPSPCALVDKNLRKRSMERKLQVCLLLIKASGRALHSTASQHSLSMHAILVFIYFVRFFRSEEFRTLVCVSGTHFAKLSYIWCIPVVRVICCINIQHIHMCCSSPYLVLR